MQTKIQLKNHPIQFDLLYFVPCYTKPPVKTFLYVEKLHFFFILAMPPCDWDSCFKAVRQAMQLRGYWLLLIHIWLHPAVLCKVLHWYEQQQKLCWSTLSFSLHLTSWPVKWWHSLLHLITSAKKVIFLVLLVCLFVSRTREKLRSRLSLNLVEGCSMGQGGSH